MTAKNRELKTKAKGLLWEKDLTIAQLARLIKRSRTWTSQVLYGHQKSEETRQAIAEILGEYIWPNGHKRAA